MKKIIVGSSLIIALLLSSCASSRNSMENNTSSSELKELNLMGAEASGNIDASLGYSEDIEMSIINTKKELEAYYKSSDLDIDFKKHSLIIIEGWLPSPAYSVYAEMKFDKALNKHLFTVKKEQQEGFFPMVTVKYSKAYLAPKTNDNSSISLVAVN